MCHPDNNHNDDDDNENNDHRTNQKHIPYIVIVLGILYIQQYYIPHKFP